MMMMSNPKLALLAVCFGFATISSNLVGNVEASATAKIVLNNRSNANMKNEDGKFDSLRAKYHLAKVVNKYDRSLTHYKQKFGVSFDESSSSTTSPASSKRRLESDSPIQESRDVIDHDQVEDEKLLERALGMDAIALELEARGTSAEALKDQDDTEWTGQTLIGTPAQKFTLDFDTGSADVWIPSNSCSANCGSKSKYTPNQSTTSNKTDATLKIGYGDGSSAQGPIYQDTVAIGSLSATGQSFGAVDTLDSSFDSDPSDGILGMAFPALSTSGNVPFFHQLIKQGKVDQPVFSFALGPQGSELFLGGYNQQKMKGKLNWVPVVDKSFWHIKGDLSVGNNKVVQDFGMVVDSGTSLIVGPTETVDKFYKALGGTACTPTGCGEGSEGFYSFPCNSGKDVAFTFNGVSYPLAGDNFNVGGMGDENLCVGSITAADKVPENSFVLGDKFMTSVLTVFDVGKSRVGFAPRDGN